MSGPFQVEFFFTGVPLNDSGAGARTDYAGFNLNGIEYKVGDAAFLYPEDESMPPYVGRVLSIFHDSSRAADPHCVEVEWFERRARLEPANPYCAGWEREVVALEETDINPIGCISGKATVLKASGFEEACELAQSLNCADWLFCRGVYKQDESCIVPYPELVEQMELCNGKRTGKRIQAGISGQAEGVADSDDVKRRRLIEEQPMAPLRRTGKLVSGRTCVECGATQTPQWREGPAGPKTLCNACGVRYVRAQQRANKRTASSGASRASCGAGSRQAKAAKAAKAAEAAAARAARAAAHVAPQRPLRQAALMAASKTAQYARTGVFPQSVTELQVYDNLTSAAAAAAAAVTTPAELLDADAAADGRYVRYGSSSSGAGRGAAAAAAAAIGRPATPNCSSYDSSGSLYEGGGVTVEVMVGSAVDEGCCDAEGVVPAAPGGAGGCCSGSGVEGMLPYFPGVAMMMPVVPGTAAGGLQQGLVLCQQQQQAAALLSPVPAAPFGGADVVCRMVPSDLTAGCVPVGPVVVVAGAAALPGMLTAGGLALQGPGPHHQGCDAGAGAGAGEPALSGDRGYMGGCGGGMEAATTATSGLESPAAAAAAAVATTAAQVLSVPVSPVITGRRSFGGSYYSDEQQLQQPQGLELQQQYGNADDDADVVVADAEGGVGVGLMDDNLNSLYGGMYGGQLVGCCCGGLDDEYGSLVEAAGFGLGVGGCGGAGMEMDGGALFGDDELHQSGILDSTAGAHRPDTGNDLSSHLTGRCKRGQDTTTSPTAAATEDVEAGVRSASDLPAVAALAEPFCADLASGSDARRLLDAMPSLVQLRLQQQRQEQQQQQQLGPSGILCPSGMEGATSCAGAAVAAGSCGGGRGEPVSAFAGAVTSALAAVACGGAGTGAGDEEGGSGGDVEAVGDAASGVMPLPEEAVTELLCLSRRASRAATEAMAADAALQAATQVLEAHQASARTAHHEVMTNLNRLKDCLSHLATTNTNTATSSRFGSTAAPEPLLRSHGSNSGAIHLIDLRHLGGGFTAAAGGGSSGGGGAGIMSGGLGGGLLYPVGGCCGFDGFDAGEMVVAVHS